MYPLRYIGFAKSSFGGSDVCGLKRFLTVQPRGSDPAFQISSRSLKSMTCTLS